MSKDSPAAGIGTYVQSWVPPAVEHVDDLSIGPSAALASVLGVELPPRTDVQDLPPMWHWLYFLNWPRPDHLADDGHPKDGSFMPPIPGRRRMWAGGRLQIHRPLRAGVKTRRVSSLVTATAKSGKSGELLLVVVRSELWQNNVLCQIEEQDHAYRSGAGDAVRKPWCSAPTVLPQRAEPWQLELHTDPILLFRISALTANSHRIHYDDPYARQVEGYPGLVVHGPLLALQMLELVRRERPGSQVSTFEYRLHQPLFVGAPALVLGMSASGSGAALAVRSAPDVLHASGQVSFTDSLGS